jgi:hypothetical protein
MDGSQTGSDLATGAFGRVPTVVVDRPVFNESQAEALARAEFNRLSLGLIAGDGVCIGNPDVRAGEVIELKGLGRRFSGLYYVVGSRHIYGRPVGGYITEFSVTRNATTTGTSSARGATGGAATAPSGGAAATANASAAGATGAAAAATAGPTATKKTDWIEVKLVDREGKPVPGEKYRIELPDGTTREGVLNSEGVAWEGNLDPGTCKITFPGLDGTEWRRA